MDPVSHRLANALVGNAPDAATLEVTLIGPELRVRGRAAGGGRRRATSICRLDGRPVPSCAAFVVPAAPRLRFGSRRSGARAYLAVAGGIDVPAVLGSRATHVLSSDGRLRGPRAARRRSSAARPVAAAQRPRRCSRAASDLTRAAAATAARSSACCPDRRPTGSPTGRSTRCSRRRTSSAINRIAWDSGSKGRVLVHRRRRRHHFRRDAARRPAGAGVGPADPADGRSSDDRRISEDRDGDHRRHWPSPVSSAPGDDDRVRGVHARARRWPR